MRQWWNYNRDRDSIRNRTAEREALGALAAADRDILAPFGRSDSGPLSDARARLRPSSARDRGVDRCTAVTRCES
jgi:hypothetical protein